MTEKTYRCPVCGNLSFAAPDDFEYCDVCGWQNDTWQEDHPDEEGGGTCNVVSLNHYREDWKAGCDPFDEYEKRKKANSEK